MRNTPTPQVSGPAMIEDLEGRQLFAISTAVDVVKVRGPTDAVVTTATNPADKVVPGQSSVIVVSNRAAKAFR